MDIIQRRPTENQYVGEKWLNIINHQGNANPNNNEVSPHSGEEA